MNTVKDRNQLVVAIHNPDCLHYPQLPPFNPPQRYPEYQLKSDLDPDNAVYAMVRDIFIQLGLDAENQGSQNWNPLGTIIKPGDTVAIKPNLVKHFHHLGEAAVLSSVTHASVLRPIIDYAVLALKGQGQLIICDTPLEKTDFAKVLHLTGIGEMVAILQKQFTYPLELIDMRQSQTEFQENGTLQYNSLSGDPRGYAYIDLGEQSEFAPLDKTPQNYLTLADHTINHYDPDSREEGQTNKHHNAGKHAYKIGKSILAADVIISVPKLKTHKKTGVTLNLKNMIGICVDKLFIPHHRAGLPPAGDAFAAPPPKSFLIKRKLWFFFLQNIAARLVKIMPLLRPIYKSFKLRLIKLQLLKTGAGPIEWGEWYGNDTLWRTILDLNKILLYADKNGVLTDKQQRKYFSIIDGIIAQEGEGPMTGEPKCCSLLLGGTDPVSVDSIAAEIMGFDRNKIPVITKTSQMHSHRLGEADKTKISVLSQDAINLKFTPPHGWKGHIELETNPESDHV